MINTDKPARTPRGFAKETVVNLKPGEKVIADKRFLNALRSAAYVVGIRLTAKPFFTPSIGWQYKVTINTEAKL